MAAIGYRICVWIPHRGISLRLADPGFRVLGVPMAWCVGGRRWSGNAVSMDVLVRRIEVLSYVVDDIHYFR